MEDERLMQQYQILKDQEAFFKNQVALRLIGDRGFAVGQRDRGTAGPRDAILRRN